MLDAKSRSLFVLRFERVLLCDMYLLGSPGMPMGTTSPLLPALFMLLMLLNLGQNNRVAGSLLGRAYLTLAAA
jgi:hypothetical protein